MPARESSKRTTAAATPDKPKFDFKKVKRAQPGSGDAGSSSGDGRKGPPKPTTTRVQRAIHQQGDKQGEESENHIFVFNPRFGLNEAATEAVKALAYPKDEVSKFNKELNGFFIRARTPTQAKRMHDALRALDAKLPETLDIGDWEDPHVTLVALTNVDLPATRYADAYTGVTAIMLEGYTYPLYKKLRPLGCDFVRDVHNKEGVNRWMRVISKSDNPYTVEKELAEMLKGEGWSVSSAHADAAEWEDEEAVE